MKSKFKYLLSFLLSIIICFSFFPSTVYAADVDYIPDSDGTVCLITSTNGSKNFSDPFNAAYGTYGTVLSYQLQIDLVHTEASKGDILSYKFNLSKPIYFKFNQLTFSLDCSDSKSNYQFFGQNISYANNVITVDFYIKKDCTIKGLTFAYLSEDGYTCAASTPFSVQISSVDNTLSTETQSLGNKISSYFSDLFDNLKSFFSSLFEWLKEIRDNAVKLGQDIKSWFTELGDKLKTFFNDLIDNIKEQFDKMINNLKTFFDDVGQWFSEIGDRIGGFFTDLWDNITAKIESITQSVSDWWQSVVDFFHSLFVPEDGYFDKYKGDWETWARAHFALFYDISDLLNEFIEMFTLFGDDKQSVFVIPELSLPFLDNPVILPQTEFDFDVLINSHKMIKYIFNLFQFVVIGLSFYFIIIYILKTFSNIFTGSEEAL